MVKFFLGLDLGQSQDYTALCVIEAISSKGKKGAAYHVRRLERTRGESYPAIAEKVSAVMRSPALAGGAALVIDQTGCGRYLICSRRPGSNHRRLHPRWRCRDPGRQYLEGSQA